jgi:hypothetical protein
MACNEGGSASRGGPATVADLNRQVSANVIGTYAPGSRADLVSVVQDVEGRGGGAKAAGSLYSLSAAAMPDSFLLRTRETLDRHLSRPFPFSDRALAPARYRSPQHDGPNLHRVLAPDATLPRGGALIHVEAGIQLRRFIADLTAVGLAVPTMGSGSSQTLAGAISTGTHGADFVVPPLGDFVRAIHLVGPRGQEYWIERTRGITDQDRLLRLPDWCPETRVVHDDELFRAALISVGRFGVWYSVVIEVVSQYGLLRETTDEPWPAFRQRLVRSVDQGYRSPGALFDQSREGQPLRALEAIYNPNADAMRVSRRWLDPTMTRPATSITGGSGISLQTILCHHHMPGVAEILAAAAGVLDGIGGALLAIPFAGLVLAPPYFKAAHELRALAFDIRFDGLTASDVISRALEIFRENRLGPVRDAVAALIGTLLDGARPTGVARGLSYQILDMSDPEDDPDCAPVDSTELFFPGQSQALVPFLDRVASRLASEVPVEAIFSLRFCGASEALLAMEQSNPTVAVEIASLKPRFRRLIGEFVDEAVALGAIPHWGQLQYSYGEAQVAQLFGQRLIHWRRALAYIDVLDPIDTFSSAFSRALGLEWEGRITSGAVPDYGRPLDDESHVLIAAHHPHR